MKLTMKQARFCHEYMIDLNATQSAIRAGYSSKTAKEIGYDNLTKVHIQDEITRLRDETSKKTDIKISDVLERIWYIAEEGEENNQLKALDMMMKHLGGYSADNIKAEPVRVIVERIGKS